MRTGEPGSGARRLTAFVITFNELRRRVRDRSAVITCLVAPLAIAAILGFAFAGNVSTAHAPDRGVGGLAGAAAGGRARQPAPGQRRGAAGPGRGDGQARGGRRHAGRRRGPAPRRPDPLASPHPHGGAGRDALAGVRRRRPGQRAARPGVRRVGGGGPGQPALRRPAGARDRHRRGGHLAVGEHARQRRQGRARLLRALHRGGLPLHRERPGHALAPHGALHRDAGPPGRLARQAGRHRVGEAPGHRPHRADLHPDRLGRDGRRLRCQTGAPRSACS